LLGLELGTGRLRLLLDLWLGWINYVFAPDVIGNLLIIIIEIVL